MEALVDAVAATALETTSAPLVEEHDGRRVEWVDVLPLIDAAADEKQERELEVNAVLSEIGASRVPQLLVLNKSDLVEDAGPEVRRNAMGIPVSVQVSAIDGRELPALVRCIDELIASDVVNTVIKLTTEQGRIRAKCFEMASVIEEVMQDCGTIEMHLRIEKKNLARLNAAITSA